MRILKIVFLTVVCAQLAFSQAQMSSGDIRGTVTDSTGAVVPNAKVTVVNIDTGVARSLVSDSVGAYRFFLLSPANYEVKFEVAGFSRYTRRPVQVTVGGTVVVDAPLQVSSITQEMVVQEELPPIETEKVQQSETITQERIQSLPINERNFLNFSLLTPGVTDSKGLVIYGLPMAATSGLSFLGQSGRSNNVTIDGVDNNDNAVAAVRSTMSQDAVQEFQINRSGYSAEFGRASGGLINIVSKSGTNELHGNLFGFFRNQSLDARNAFAFGPGGSKIDPPYSRQQAGFTIGGPLKKDRTFFFLSYEGLRQRESRFATFLENESFFQPTAGQKALLAGMAASPVAQLRGLAAAFGPALTTTEQAYPQTVQLLRSNSGAFPFKNNDNTSSFRLDHSLSPANQMFARFTFSDIDTTGGSVSGLRGPSRSGNYQIQDFAAVFGDTHFINARQVNEFRFQFANRDYGTTPVDPYGPEISINGVAFLGRDYFLPSMRNEKRYQFVDNFTSVVGNHQLKFGGDYNYIPFDTTTEIFFGGRFIFGEQVPLGMVIDGQAGAGTSTGIGQALAAAGRADLIPQLSAPVTALQSYNFGLPLVYQQGFGNPKATLTNHLISAYVQDTYKPIPELTLNMGLRYDVELQPTPIHRDKNNFGPRLGFSYSPDAKTVLRGGYGIYFAPLFEAIAFVGRVLDGTQISQVFVPLTGLPQLGISATSAQVWALSKRNACTGASLVSNPYPCSRSLTAADIAPLGLRPGVTPPILLRAHPGVVNPYSQQFSLGIDRELAGGMAVSLNYNGNHGLKVIRSRNINLRESGANAFGPTFSSIDPRVLQDNVAESSGASIYHGLAVSVTKRFSQHYQFQTSYTLAKAIDDTTDFITDLQPSNQLNLHNERSLSSFDQRHRLVVSSVLESPLDPAMGIGRVLNGFKVSPIVTYSSGHPFNLLLGFDANNDTQANTDRPLAAGRNTGIGPDLMTVDVSVSREARFGLDGRFGFEGIFQAFNLFNRVNYSGVNNIVGNTPFTTYRVTGRRDVGPATPLGFTSAFDPRQIQLGVRFRY